MFLSLLTALVQEYADWCQGRGRADSSASAESSSFNVLCAENGSLFNLLVFSVFQGGAREVRLCRGAHNPHSCGNVPVGKSRAPP